ncbi:1917_t:CDS:2, partial [Cetraspora pellucida]
DVENEGTFDEFKFKDELLEEAEGYFISKISEELPSSKPDLKEESLKKLNSEKGIFTYDLNDLEQMDALVYKIDTGSAISVKKASYHAASSI